MFEQTVPLVPIVDVAGQPREGSGGSFRMSDEVLLCFIHHTVTSLPINFWLSVRSAKVSRLGVHCWFLNKRDGEL